MDLRRSMLCGSNANQQACVTVVRNRRLLLNCRCRVWLGNSLQWFKSTIGKVVPSWFESNLHFGGNLLHLTQIKGGNLELYQGSCVVSKRNGRRNDAMGAYASGVPNFSRLSNVVPAAIFF